MNNVSEPVYSWLRVSPPSNFLLAYYIDCASNNRLLTSYTPFYMIQRKNPKSRFLWQIPGNWEVNSGSPSLQKKQNIDRSQVLGKVLLLRIIVVYSHRKILYS